MNGSSFISKFNSSGQRIWSTYFGLSQNLSTTVITDIAVSGNNLYITGVTNASSGVATQEAFQPTKAGASYTGTDNRDAYDGYITKFDLNGNRIWGTYCGGTLEDRVNKIQVKNNAIFIAGITKSPDGISTLDGFQNSLTPPVDATTAIYFFDSFVSKFDLNGTKIWGSYYGGSKGESIKNNTEPDTFILLNDTGTFYLAGNTSSENNVATSDGHQPAWNNLPNTNQYPASTNFYLAKFDPVPLNTENFTFNNLKFAPNPTTNVVTISNNSTIESFEILTVLGQKLVSKNFNSLQAQIDFSAFSNGIYFIKISSQGFEKIIKILKE
ncbi:MAG: T9SS type A sorting domain-containing protein [Flavobacterium sp.]|nr:T9SS type A sorting domain-containing protein [Flavobacterium sp.]